MTVAYGLGISVSPMHLVNAVGAVANDGKLHPMTMVKGGTSGRFDGKVVLSEKTVTNMRDLLRLVVRYGTGKSANAPGYDVGGKTGTAEKNVGGIYNKNNKLTVFASVFPVYQPRYAILVIVDEPRGDKSTYGFATGGWISAPVVGRMVQRMAPLLAMQPDFTNRDGRVEAMWAEATGRAQRAAQAKAEQTEGVHATAF
jgi:cell division protein FtsI (penicillin-binding protein 3)